MLAGAEVVQLAARDTLQFAGAIMVAALGGGTLGVLGVKWMNRPVDRATAEKLQAEARSTAQQTASSEVQTIRDVLAEVRESDAAKSEEIREIRDRLGKLEERERHMLTRAAVHEAWDRLAFQKIVLGDDSFPPPPPLIAPEDRPQL